jgi:hypothetical protein
MPETPMHKGSCHCGAVEFQVPMDATSGTRCNCTVCTKTAYTGQRAQPGSLTVTKGRDALSGYTTKSATRYFCKHCGVHLYGEGYVAEIGGDFLSVNLQALDDIDLSEVKIGYFDGRHDNWMAGLRDSPWPSR